MLSPQNSVGMCLIMFIEAEQVHQLPTYCGSTLKIMQTYTCIKGGCIDIGTHRTLWSSYQTAEMAESCHYCTDAEAIALQKMSSPIPNTDMERVRCHPEQPDSHKQLVRIVELRGGLLTHLWRACDPPPLAGLCPAG